MLKPVVVREPRSLMPGDGVPSGALIGNVLTQAYR